MAAPKVNEKTKEERKHAVLITQIMHSVSRLTGIRNGISIFG